MFTQHSLTRGERLGVLAPNTAEHVIAVFAALRLGAIAVPIGARLAPPEVADILLDAGCRVLAHDPALADPVVLATRDLGPGGVPDLVALGPPGNPGALLREAAHARPVVDDRASEADDAFIIYTSGTTGRPKGVLLDHHRAVWAAMAQIATAGCATATATCTWRRSTTPVASST